MIIAVGSQNPVKIEAVTQAFGKVFGKCQVIGVSVSSEVSEMPIGFDEIVAGAKNRAQKAIEELKADFGVGLEGGLEKTEIGVFLTGFVAVIDRNGIWGYGRGNGLLMPDGIIKEVERGKELGTVMNEIMKEDNVKQKGGAIGFFTNNLIPRPKAFEITTINALARFMKKEFY